jgi:hypothetical protein
MRTTTCSAWLPFVFTLSAVACTSATGPTTTTLVLSTPPNFVAVVTSNTLEQGNSPAGYISQHNIWVTIQSALATEGNAGVVVGESCPVFVRVKDSTFVRAAAGAIKVGDDIQVWHDQGVEYGTGEAPPGAPAYSGQQIVILR